MGNARTSYRSLVHFELKSALKGEYVKKIRRTLFIMASVMFILLMSPPISARADGTFTAALTGKYEQTEARSMLNMVNEFRASSEAWYWDETDSQKLMQTHLEPLQYDYELEKAAMKRAAELAVMYAHTRPNGSSPFSAYPDSYSYTAAGENIAYGYRSAYSVFKAWREDNDNYSGQGHRRNMLRDYYNRVGFGCFVYDGTVFWVQEFANSNSGNSYQPANDALTTVSIDIPRSNITGSRIIWRYYSNEKIEFYPGTETPCSDIQEIISVSATRDGKTEYSSFCYPNDRISIADTSVVRIQGGSIIPVKTGKTTLSMISAVDGRTLTMPLEVKGRDISWANWSMSGYYLVYTGKPLKPSITMSYNSKQLEEGIDYTVTYKNNVNPGNATAVITGIGEFAGSSRTFNFTIVPASIYSANYTLKTSSYTYTGKAIKPKVSLTYNQKTLKEGTDYTLSYKNNTKVGTAQIIITGKNGFKGSSRTETFTIKKAVKKPLAKGKAFTYKSMTYKVTNSSSKNPTVTLTKAGTGTKSLTIPDKVYDKNKIAYKVTAIGASACKKNSKLKTLVIGKNVTSIGSSAFTGCSRLESITFHNTKVKIGKNAFKGIKKKAYIKIKSGTKTAKKKFVTTINKTGAAKTAKLK